MGRHRAVQCRPPTLKPPIHELGSSEQGKYEEGKEKTSKARRQNATLYPSAAWRGVPESGHQSAKARDSLVLSEIFVVSRKVQVGGFFRHVDPTSKASL